MVGGVVEPEVLPRNRKHSSGGAVGDAGRLTVMEQDKRAPCAGGNCRTPVRIAGPVQSQLRIRTKFRRVQSVKLPEGC
jgi:hypothetical protein